MTEFNKPLTPDQVNYFHYIGKPYPDPTIVQSKDRMFLSVFDFDRAYVVLKVVNTECSSQINGVELSAYRKNTALFLGIDFLSETSSLFHSIVPIDPKQSRYPNYCEEDEIMQFDIHLVCAVSGVLLKVVQAMPNDFDFCHGFAAEHKQLRGIDYQPIHYTNAITNFYSQTPTQRDKDQVYTTECTVLKHEPSNDEPPLTGAQSRQEALLAQSLLDDVEV